MRTPLSKEEIDGALENLDGWSFGNDRLTKSFQFDDFRSAIAFIVRLAFEAEDLDHHPTLENVYNRVDLALNTHDAGGKVTGTDVELATRIDAL
jgi:4a-hydroxytetrahydrobiopterin dehydratase